MKKTVSIIIPVFNEEKTLAKIIGRVRLANLGPLSKELIVIDDASSDDSAQVLKRMSDIKFFQHGHNQGKGAAIRTGLKHATGDIIIIQDADLEYNPDEYSVLLNPLLQGKTSVVYGSRFLKETHNSDYSKGSKFYYFGNRMLSLLTTLIYGQRVTDMETCYKAFNADILRSIPFKAQRFDFEPEITAKLLRKGHTILEVPITYSPRSIEEGKKINWKDGLKAIYYLIKYRFTD